MDGDVSPAAQAANRRLYELREQLAARQGGAARRRAGGDDGEPAAAPRPAHEHPSAVSHSLLTVAHSLSTTASRPPTSPSGAAPAARPSGLLPPPLPDQAPCPTQSLAQSSAAGLPGRLPLALPPPLPDQALCPTQSSAASLPARLSGLLPQPQSGQRQCPAESSAESWAANLPGRPPLVLPQPFPDQSQCPAESLAQSSAAGLPGRLPLVLPQPQSGQRQCPAESSAASLLGRPPVGPFAQQGRPTTPSHSEKLPAPQHHPIAPAFPPATPTTQPIAPTSHPATPTAQPIAPTSHPATPTTEPVAQAFQLASSTTQPVAPTSHSATPTAPIAPTSQPATPTEPVAQAFQLASPVTAPIAPTAQPTTPIAPIAPTFQPTTPTQPVAQAFQLASLTEPIAPTSQLASPATQPIASTSQPTTAQPIASASQPATPHQEDNALTFAEAAALLAALPPTFDCLLPTDRRPPAAAHGRPVDSERAGGVASTVGQPGRTSTTSHSEPMVTLANHIANLPPHLGWGSETLTAHLRKMANRAYGEEGEQGRKGEREQGSRGERSVTPHSSLVTHHSSLDAHHSSLVTRHSSLVKVYPAIALGLLRQERTAAGRLWLLLRHLDAPGRGMVTIADARAALTTPGSPLRLCGWRRLRQLLAEGEGVFWTRQRAAPDRGGHEQSSHPSAEGRTCQVAGRNEGDRLWLHGPARVAAALGVRRLVGRPVGLPPSALLGPIGDARAHLYATFHSGRVKEITNYELRMTNEENTPNSSLVTRHSSLVTRHSSLGSPIARDTLAALSGVCARSQAAYERRVGVRARANIALGERVAAAPGAPIGPTEQERAWRQGRALFRLRDHHGHHGRPGATYLAWRLPNAYGPARGHQTRPKGRQKRINRQLADLFTKGMTGNDEPIAKRFYPTAAAAVKAGEREKGVLCSSLVTRHSSLHTRHWPAGGAGRGGCRVWATVEVMKQ